MHPLVRIARMASAILSVVVPTARAAKAIASPRLRGPAARSMQVSASASADLREAFYVAALEVGQERHDLPLWAMRPEIPEAAAFPFLGIGRDDGRQAASRRDIGGVAGGFQLLSVLSSDECQSIVAALDALGFHSDAAVSLPYSFRHMTNCNLISPDGLDGEIFERCSHLLPDIGGCPPLGLNAKFRCYRYGDGDYFKPHTDGAWPGTRVRDRAVLQDAYGDRLSQLTCLILLTEDYEGGETRFLSGPGDENGVAVRTPRGGMLCFPHGMHPDSPLHEGSLVRAGWKYMIRTEVLYSLDAARALRGQARL
mmetsp:Transcript_51130/g.164143  ORF Transcript_51130/g.164143 Transcript_51130/m.164143 type:complete len:311 (+) Transcript_51130:92-1024(+)